VEACGIHGTGEVQPGRGTFRILYKKSGKVGRRACQRPGRGQFHGSEQPFLQTGVSSLNLNRKNFRGNCAQRPHRDARRSCHDSRNEESQPHDASRCGENYQAIQVEANKKQSGKHHKCPKDIRGGVYPSVSPPGRIELPC
jgi:hypothetical protein